MFAPASVSFVSSVIVRMSFMVARVLFALSLVMFNISRYGIFVSVTDTVLVAVSGTFPAGSGCAMYSIRYVPGIRELTALVLDVIVLLYAGSSSVTLAPFSTYSLYSSTDYIVTVDGQIWFYCINKDVS